jgi:DNA repair ATPase RecN
MPITESLLAARLSTAVKLRILVFDMLKSQGQTESGATMTGQETDMPTPKTAISEALEAKNGSEAEIVDRAGNAILGLVNRAADAAAADLREAREVAEKLTDELRATDERLRAAQDQLRAAHEQINDLKADVRHYQDRASRAEKWLQQISSEIEQKFLGADDSRTVRPLAPQQNESNNPARLAFLRRRQDH